MFFLYTWEAQESFLKQLVPVNNSHADFRSVVIIYIIYMILKLSMSSIDLKTSVYLPKLFI